MAYRAPGVYAAFQRTAAAPVNVGTSRIMALIGTGIDYYSVINEGVARNSDKPYDVLRHENVFELTVSSRPVYATKNNPENIIYTPTTYNKQGLLVQEGDYELVDGKYIVWRSLSKNNSDDADADVQLKLANVDTDPYVNEGSRSFEEQCTYSVNQNRKYLIVDGNWRVEVTYAAQHDGCYRVINEDTNELIGEYVCSDEENSEAIPGVHLIVPRTYKKPADADVDSEENEIQAGDYFIISTRAYKTELEASLTIDTSAVTTIPLAQAIKKINLINPNTVKAGTYKIVLKDNEANFQLVQSTDSGDVVIYPSKTNTDATQPWVPGDEIYDVIPGFEIILGALPSDYAPIANNAVILIAKERQITPTEDSNIIPGEGDTYYVTYKYRKSDAGYEPQYFSSYKDILNEYGSFDATASGVVQNSLTLGANIAFANGVSQIICVQVKGNTDAEFCAAIDKLRQPIPGVDNVNTLVPLTTSPVVGTYCSNHVSVMSSYDYSKECMCYLSAFPNQKMSKYPSGADRSLGIMESCEGYANERVVYVVPGRAVKSITSTATGRTYDRILPGCYLAVAVACLGLGSDPAEPITNKAIAGFSYLVDTYTENELNNMAAKGACLLFMRGNSIIVRHGITTDPSDVNTYEITSIQIKDYVIEAVRTSCKQYIGRKNIGSVVSDITYTINTVLSQFVNRVIIESYTGLSVERSAEDPRAVNVEFKIRPIYSLTYIDITFSFTS